MIASYSSSAADSLVAKNLTEKIISLLLIKSSPVDRFQCLRHLKDPIDLPHMIESLASGATNCLMAKIEPKELATSCSVNII